MSFLTALPYSVPADIQPLEKLFVQKDGAAGVDQYGLKVYWCVRSTSGEEGMHYLMNKLYKGGHYGTELAQVCGQQATAGIAVCGCTAMVLCVGPTLVRCCAVSALVQCFAFECLVWLYVCCKQLLKLSCWWQ